MRPRPQIGRWSTYTVLGLLGYAVAAIAVGTIGAATGASLTERAAAIVLPPIGFWAMVTLERRITGVERIIFYRTAIAAWCLPVAVAFAASARAGVVSDLVVLLVAIVLAFGRVGCFHVACCHGRPARFGVRYTHAHALPRRLIGRPLLPVQLIEALASALLSFAAAALLVTGAAPGAATSTFVVAYACVRFVLELLRGDAARPYVARVSEAQWIALATTAGVALVAQSLPYAIVALGLAAGALTQMLRTPKLSELLHEPRHLEELELVHRSLVDRREPAPAMTSAGLRVSVRMLPSGPLDVVWSHDRLREYDARALVRELALDGEVLAARTEGMFHVLVPTARAD